MAGQIINKVSAGGGTHLISPSTFFTCSTDAETKAKVAKLVDTNVTGTITITEGTVIWVYFENSTLAHEPTLTLQNSSGTNLTLKNSSGTTISQPKGIYAAALTLDGRDATDNWSDDSIVSFIWFDNCWNMIDQNKAEQQATSSNSDFPVLLSPAATISDIVDWTSFSSKIKANPSTGNLTVTSINGHGFSTSINAESAPVNDTLPTVSAVAAYVAESCPEEVIISDTEPDPTDTKTKIWVQL